MRVPIIINNFNRHASLIRLLEWLRHVDCAGEIYIIDNNSTYIKTIELYNEIEKFAKIIRLSRNNGYLAPTEFLRSNTIDSSKPFIVTDPDLTPNKCPHDVIEKMLGIIDTKIDINKVGVLMDISDIPEYFPLKDHVVAWENHFVDVNNIRNEYIEFDVDTTFALYRDINSWGRHRAVRLKYPYVMKHDDWYIDPHNVPDEYKFYLDHANNDSSYAMRFKFVYDSCVGDVIDFRKSIIGMRYILENIEHKSKTVLTFYDDYVCHCWGIMNRYKVLPNNKIQISYCAGSFDIDIIKFNDEYTSFCGKSFKNVTIKGSLL